MFGVQKKLFILKLKPAGHSWVIFAEEFKRLLEEVGCGEH